MNLKWCHKCRRWKKTEEFGKDSTRTSGIDAVCRDCRSVYVGENPSIHTRKAMKSLGLKYCRFCKTWLPQTDVRGGLCKFHRNKYARDRYANNAKFCNARRNRSAHYRRNVQPVPVDGRENLLEEFDGKCAYCGEPSTTWDHIIPVSKGGKTTPGNIVPCCFKCNSSKKAQDVFEWVKKTGKKISHKLIDRIILAEQGFYG